MHRSAAGIDGDRDRHVLHVESVDGFHAEVGKADHPGGLDGLGDELGGAADGQHAALDLFLALVALGHVGGIGVVAEVGLWQGTGQRREYRETAQAGIENADHDSIGGANADTRGTVAIG